MQELPPWRTTASPQACPPAGLAVLCFTSQAASRMKVYSERSSDSRVETNCSGGGRHTFSAQGMGEMSVQTIGSAQLPAVAMLRASFEELLGARQLDEGSPEQLDMRDVADVLFADTPAKLARRMDELGIAEHPTENRVVVSGRMWGRATDLARRSAAALGCLQYQYLFNSALVTLAGYMLLYGSSIFFRGKSFTTLALGQVRNHPQSGYGGRNVFQLRGGNASADAPPQFLHIGNSSKTGKAAVGVFDPLATVLLAFLCVGVRYGVYAESVRSGSISLSRERREALLEVLMFDVFALPQVVAGELKHMGSDYLFSKLPVDFFTPLFAKVGVVMNVTMRVQRQVMAQVWICLEAEAAVMMRNDPASAQNVRNATAVLEIARKNNPGNAESTMVHSARTAAISYASANSVGPGIPVLMGKINDIIALVNLRSAVYGVPPPQPAQAVDFHDNNRGDDDAVSPLARFLGAGVKESLSRHGTQSGARGEVEAKIAREAFPLGARPGQLDFISHILFAPEVIVVGNFGVGWGKTRCVLAAISCLARGTIAVVVVPTNALTEEWGHAARAAHVAVYVWSSSTVAELRPRVLPANEPVTLFCCVFDQMASLATHLAGTSHRDRVAMVVVDEAHMATTATNCFRPTMQHVQLLAHAASRVVALSGTLNYGLVNTIGRAVGVSGAALVYGGTVATSGFRSQLGVDYRYISEAGTARAVAAGMVEILRDWGTFEGLIDGNVLVSVGVLATYDEVATMLAAEDGVTLVKFKGGATPDEIAAVRRGLDEGVAEGFTAVVLISPAGLMGFNPVGVVRALVDAPVLGGTQDLLQSIGRAGRGNEDAMTLVVVHDFGLDMLLRQTDSELAFSTPECVEDLKSAVDLKVLHQLLTQELPLAPCIRQLFLRIVAWNESGDIPDCAQAGVRFWCSPCEERRGVGGAGAGARAGAGMGSSSAVLTLPADSNGSAALVAQNQRAMGVGALLGAFFEESPTACYLCSSAECMSFQNSSSVACRHAFVQLFGTGSPRKVHAWRDCTVNLHTACNLCLSTGHYAKTFGALVVSVPAGNEDEVQRKVAACALVVPRSTLHSRFQVCFRCLRRVQRPHVCTGAVRTILFNAWFVRENRAALVKISPEVGEMFDFQEFFSWAVFGGPPGSTVTNADLVVGWFVERLIFLRPQYRARHEVREFLGHPR